MADVIGLQLLSDIRTLFSAAALPVPWSVQLLQKELTACLHNDALAHHEDPLAALANSLAPFLISVAILAI